MRTAADDLHLEAARRGCSDTGQHLDTEGEHRVLVGVVPQGADEQEGKRSLLSTRQSTRWGDRYRVRENPNVGPALALPQAHPIELGAHVDAIGVAQNAGFDAGAPLDLAFLLQRQLGLAGGAVERCQAEATDRFHVVEVEVPRWTARSSARFTPVGSIMDATGVANMAYVMEDLATLLQSYRRGQLVLGGVRPVRSGSPGLIVST